MFYHQVKRGIEIEIELKKIAFLIPPMGRVVHSRDGRSWGQAVSYLAREELGLGSVAPEYCSRPNTALRHWRGLRLICLKNC